MAMRSAASMSHMMRLDQDLKLAAAVLHDPD
jgi:hypothetical protein